MSFSYSLSLRFEQAQYAIREHTKLFTAYPHTHTHTHAYKQSPWIVWQLPSRFDELCLLCFRTFLLLIWADRTTGRFTHHICIQHIVSRCAKQGKKKKRTKGEWKSHINVKIFTAVLRTKRPFVTTWKQKKKKSDKKIHPFILFNYCNNHRE